MGKERYYVDERICCIAVRDRTLDSEHEPGLHSYTTGVIQYWHGTQKEPTPCPTCGHKGLSPRMVSDDIKAEAEVLCNKMNKEENDPTTKSNQVSH